MELIIYLGQAFVTGESFDETIKVIE